MRRISVTIVLSFVCTIIFGQTKNAIKLADSLLKTGRFNAAITKYDFPEEIKILQARALTSLKNDPVWADKYIIKLVESGDRELKYNEAFGLTKEEFAGMLSGFVKGQIPIYSDTSKILIKKTGGVISLETSGELQPFSFISFDTRNNVIYLDNRRVTREIAIDGKLYAPILKGVECFGSEEVVTLKRKSRLNFSGISIGVNKSDFKPTLCLVHVGEAKDNILNQPRFIIMTIL
jgi:hypothetical protein